MQDDDGLLACGVPGVQVTWMDAKVGDLVVTPRIGKPVEVQALWINALRCAGGRYDAMAARAETAFRDLFWNPGSGCLHDVVDVDHRAGASIPVSGRIRFSPSADCHSQSWTPMSRAQSSRPSSTSC